MLRYMLDTNLCVRVLRDRPPELRERFNQEAEGLCVSTIVIGVGARAQRRVRAQE